MSSKRWLVVLPIAILLAICCALFIILTRFGVFSGPVSDHGGPNSPGIDKLAWLDKHYEQYDSYIIGSSAAASYSAEELNGYLDASFYNLFVCTCDAGLYRDVAAYVLEHYTVKNIVLSLGIDEAACRNEGQGTELSRPLDEFPEGYDIQMRDAEKIGDPAVYEAAYAGVFSDGQGSEQLPYSAHCAQTVADIRDMCAERGVNLFVIASPVYAGQWNTYDETALRAYKTAIAGTVDYWDFSCTPVSFDSRYFYDQTHFRSAVGTMVLAEIFGNGNVYRPERFGRKITSDNCEAYLDELFYNPPVADTNSYTVDVPILLYHGIVEEPGSDLEVSPKTFGEQMRFLAENGYHAVTTQDLIDYVCHGGQLPDRPVFISFDDGYLNNYEYAWPVLEQYGLKATVYAIGVSVGHDRFYKDTQFEMTPHFSYEQAREMVESGVIDVQSHTYDMHQWAPFETGNRVRSNILPFENESESDYIAALAADIELYDSIRKDELGAGFTSLAYPGGEYVALTEVAVHQAGIPVTMSTRTDSRNVLVRGLPQSLYALCRWYITENTTREELLAVLNG